MPIFAGGIIAPGVTARKGIARHAPRGRKPALRFAF